MAWCASIAQQAHLDDGVAAAEAYLREAAMPRESRTAFERRRDDAYRLAHDARSACLAAFAEPPPVPARVRAMLPYAEGSWRSSMESPTSPQSARPRIRICRSTGSSGASMTCRVAVSRS